MPHITLKVSDRVYKSLRKRVLEEKETTSEFIVTALSIRGVECDESDYGPRSKRKKFAANNSSKLSNNKLEILDHKSLYRVRFIAQCILGNAAAKWLSTENSELGGPPIILLLKNPEIECDIIDLICRTNL